jgi:hypothetical protein
MKKLNLKQVERIQDDTSKTRLSILFYGFLRDSRQIAEHTLSLLEIFNKTFQLNHKDEA